MCATVTHSFYNKGSSIQMTLFSLPQWQLFITDINQPNFLFSWRSSVETTKEGEGCCWCGTKPDWLYLHSSNGSCRELTWPDMVHGSTSEDWLSLHLNPETLGSKCSVASLGWRRLERHVTLVSALNPKFLETLLKGALKGNLWLWEMYEDFT